MSNYFSFFPTIQHDLKDINKKTELTNILRRFKVKTKVKDLVSTYYDYTMHEGDRMDTIAERYYDSNLAWAILHFNDIIDPYYDLPLFVQRFSNYITEKWSQLQQLEQLQKIIFKILAREKVLIDVGRFQENELL